MKWHSDTTKNILIHRILPWVITVSVLLVLFVPINRKVDMTLPCTVLDQKNEAFKDITEVTFFGTYSDYLLKKDKFEGIISCDKYKIMDADTMPVLIEVGDYTYQHLRNIINYGVTFDITYPATIYAEEDFQSFFIWTSVPVEGKSDTYTGRYFLCYPEMTLQEIYAILDSQ
mgnify:CR=1 FL=1